MSEIPVYGGPLPPRDTSNGAAHFDERWVIAMVGARDLIGRTAGADPTHAGKQMLSPVFLLVTNLLNGPQGQVAVARQILPLFLLESVDRIAIPADSPMIQIIKLAPEEQKQLAELLERVRVAKSTGLVIPPANTKIPPFRPGHQ